MPDGLVGGKKLNFDRLLLDCLNLVSIVPKQLEFLSGVVAEEFREGGLSLGLVLLVLLPVIRLELFVMTNET